LGIGVRAPLLKRAVAELVGTYVLVAAGSGAIIVDSQSGALGHLGIALTFGLVIMVMISAVGHLSGAHFNPAVTVAFALTRHFAWRDVVAYITTQLCGAILGALTTLALFGPVANLGSTVPVGRLTQSFALEALLTAVLMFVIISVATDTRAVGQLAAVAIGATVALNALWGGPISGASMNPARSFGPALVAGVWSNQWIYWLAPIIGASLGGLLYQWLREPLRETPAPVTAPVRVAPSDCDTEGRDR
jgi:MIP family channel proteins